MDTRPVRFQSPAWRTGDALVGVLARAGVGPHTKPVVPVEHEGRRWLVAPYGPVGWVRNARADARLVLRHGRDSREYVAREATAAEAGPVIKRYLNVASKVRSWFPVPADAPVEEFLAAAPAYPVFELLPAP